MECWEIVRPLYLKMNSKFNFSYVPFFPPPHFIIVVYPNIILMLKLALKEHGQFIPLSSL